MASSSAGVASGGDAEESTLNALLRVLSRCRERCLSSTLAAPAVGTGDSVKQQERLQVVQVAALLASHVDVTAALATEFGVHEEPGQDDAARRGGGEFGAELGSILALVHDVWDSVEKATAQDTMLLFSPEEEAARKQQKSKNRGSSGWAMVTGLFGSTDSEDSAGSGAEAERAAAGSPLETAQRVRMLADAADLMKDTNMLLVEINSAAQLAEAVSALVERDEHRTLATVPVYLRPDWQGEPKNEEEWALRRLSLVVNDKSRSSIKGYITWHFCVELWDALHREKEIFMDFFRDVNTYLSKLASLSQLLELCCTHTLKQADLGLLHGLAPGEDGEFTNVHKFREEVRSSAERCEQLIDLIMESVGRMYEQVEAIGAHSDSLLYAEATVASDAKNKQRRGGRSAAVDGSGGGAAAATDGSATALDTEVQRSRWMEVLEVTEVALDVQRARFNDALRLHAARDPASADKATIDAERNWAAAADAGQTAKDAVRERHLQNSLRAVHTESVFDATSAALHVVETNTGTSFSDSIGGAPAPGAAGDATNAAGAPTGSQSMTATVSALKSPVVTPTRANMEDHDRQQQGEDDRGEQSAGGAGGRDGRPALDPKTRKQQASALGTRTGACVNRIKQALQTLNAAVDAEAAQRCRHAAANSMPPPQSPSATSMGSAAGAGDPTGNGSGAGAPVLPRDSMQLWHESQVPGLLAELEGIIVQWVDQFRTTCWRRSTKILSLARYIFRLFFSADVFAYCIDNSTAALDEEDDDLTNSDRQETGQPGTAEANAQQHQRPDNGQQATKVFVVNWKSYRSVQNVILQIFPSFAAQFSTDRAVQLMTRRLRAGKVSEPSKQGFERSKVAGVPLPWLVQNLPVADVVSAPTARGKFAGIPKRGKRRPQPMKRAVSDSQSTASSNSTDAGSGPGRAVARKAKSAKRARRGVGRVQQEIVRIGDGPAAALKQREVEFSTGVSLGSVESVANCGEFGLSLNVSDSSNRRRTLRLCSRSSDVRLRRHPLPRAAGATALTEREAELRSLTRQRLYSEDVVSDAAARMCIAVRLEAVEQSRSGSASVAVGRNGRPPLSRPRSARSELLHNKQQQEQQQQKKPKMPAAKKGGLGDSTVTEGKSLTVLDPALALGFLTCDLDAVLRREEAERHKRTLQAAAPLGPRGSDEAGTPDTGRGGGSKIGGSAALVGEAVASLSAEGGGFMRETKEFGRLPSAYEQRVGPSQDGEDDEAGVPSAMFSTLPPQAHTIAADDDIAKDTVEAEQKALTCVSSGFRDPVLLHTTSAKPLGSSSVATTSQLRTRPLTTKTCVPATHAAAWGDVLSEDGEMQPFLAVAGCKAVAAMQGDARTTESSANDALWWWLSAREQGSVEERRADVCSRFATAAAAAERPALGLLVTACDMPLSEALRSGALYALPTVTRSAEHLSPADFYDEMCTHVHRVLAQCAAAVRAVHDAGYLHGDVKPESFSYSLATGQIVLGNFRYSAPLHNARAQDVHANVSVVVCDALDGDTSNSSSSSNNNNNNNTDNNNESGMSAVLLGCTPVYASPEVLRFLSSAQCLGSRFMEDDATGLSPTACKAAALGIRMRPMFTTGQAELMMKMSPGMKAGAGDDSAAESAATQELATVAPFAQAAAGSVEEDSWFTGAVERFVSPKQPVAMPLAAVAGCRSGGGSSARSGSARESDSPTHDRKHKRRGSRRNRAASGGNLSVARAGTATENKSGGSGSGSTRTVPQSASVADSIISPRRVDREESAVVPPHMASVDVHAMLQGLDPVSGPISPYAAFANASGQSTDVWCTGMLALHVLSCAGLTHCSQDASTDAGEDHGNDVRGPLRVRNLAEPSMSPAVSCLRDVAMETAPWDWTPERVNDWLEARGGDCVAMGSESTADDDAAGAEAAAGNGVINGKALLACTMQALCAPSVTLGKECAETALEGQWPRVLHRARDELTVIATTPAVVHAVSAMLADNPMERPADALALCRASEAVVWQAAGGNAVVDGQNSSPMPDSRTGADEPIPEDTAAAPESEREGRGAPLITMPRPQHTMLTLQRSVRQVAVTALRLGMPNMAETVLENGALCARAPVAPSESPNASPAGSRSSSPAPAMFEGSAPGATATSAADNVTETESLELDNHPKGLAAAPMPTVPPHLGHSWSSLTARSTRSEDTDDSGAGAGGDDLVSEFAARFSLGVSAIHAMDLPRAEAHLTWCCEVVVGAPAPAPTHAALTSTSAGSSGGGSAPATPASASPTPPGSALSSAAGRRVCPVGPVPPSLVHFALALCLFLSGRLEEAWQHVRAASDAAVDRKMMQLFTILHGKLWRHEGDMIAAIASFQTASFSGLGAGATEAQIELGITMQLQHAPVISYSAESAFNSALEMEPTHTRAHLFMAVLLLLKTMPGKIVKDVTVDGVEVNVHRMAALQGGRRRTELMATARQADEIVLEFWSHITAALTTECGRESVDRVIDPVNTILKVCGGLHAPVGGLRRASFTDSVSRRASYSESQIHMKAAAAAVAATSTADAVGQADTANTDTDTDEDNDDGGAAGDGDGNDNAERKEVGEDQGETGGRAQQQQQQQHPVRDLLSSEQGEEESPMRRTLTPERVALVVKSVMAWGLPRTCTRQWSLLCMLTVGMLLQRGYSKDVWGPILTRVLQFDRYALARFGDLLGVFGRTHFAERLYLAQFLASSGEDEEVGFRLALLHRDDLPMYLQGAIPTYGSYWL